MERVRVLGDPSSSVLELLREEDVGRAIASAIVAPQSWVHRRVETVTFSNDQALRRRVSVDLTLGDQTPSVKAGDGVVHLVPLTLLVKRTLSSLDVVEESGNSLPVLTTQQNGTLAGNTLCRLASVFAGGANVGAIRQALLNVAAKPISEARAESDELRTRLSKLSKENPLHALANSEPFSDYLRMFADSFLLVAVVRGSVGDRRILKFSYEEPIHESESTGSWRSRVAQTMGWHAREYLLALPGLVNTESFHLEVVLPDGVTVNGAAQFGRGLEMTNPDQLVDYSDCPLPRKGERSFHFHSSGEGSERAEAYFWVRIARSGWLTTALVATFVLAALAIANALRLPTLLRARVGAVAGGPVSTDVAALLMGLVAVLASFAVRLGEHPVTARAVFGVRVATLLAVSTPLAAGWLLAFGPRGSNLRVLWWVLAVLAVLLFVLVLAAWVGPNAVTPISYGSSSED